MTEKRGRIKQKILNHTPNTLVISGLHPVRALLKTGRVSEVWIREGSKGHRLSEVILESKMNNIFVKTVAARIFEDALPQVESNHQGVIAIARPREMEPENSLPILLDNVKNPLILVLDGITDPHNFGACLRSAEAFGVTCVVVPKDNSAPLNHIARKTSSGASEFIPVVRVTNLARCLKGLQKNGFWVIGAAGDSTGGLDQMEGAGSVALVMGSEGAGLRRLTRENCDALVSISMCGQIESLNVSVATGVLLFDLQTRRGKLDSDSALKERV